MKKLTKFKSMAGEEIGDVIVRHFHSLEPEEKQFLSDMIQEMVKTNALHTNIFRLAGKTHKPGKKIPKLLMKKSFQKNVLEGLKSNFSTADWKLLKALLDGKHINKRILFNGEPIQLLYLFNQLLCNEKISNTTENIAGWICNYFLHGKTTTEKNRFDYDSVNKSLNTLQFKLPKKKIPVRGLRQFYALELR